MFTSVNKVNEQVAATDVRFEKNILLISLSDGRMVWQVLEQVASGMAWETIEEWRGKVSKEAIAEAIALSY